MLIGEYTLFRIFFFFLYFSALKYKKKMNKILHTYYDFLQVVRECRLKSYGVWMLKALRS